MRDQPVSPGECSSRWRDESSGSSSSVRLADLSGCPLQEREMQNMLASQHQQSRTNTFKMGICQRLVLSKSGRNFGPVLTRIKNEH